MKDKSVHIISFDNPYPADYGGAIDVFYKIKALHALGYKITLHCFYDKRSLVVPELSGLTEAVFLYKKRRNPLLLFSLLPFAVRSRYDPELAANIAQNDAPLLFEGLQTTMLLRGMPPGHRKLFLRLHNLESDYYAGIARSEQGWLKKVLYKIDAYRFARYEQLLPRFDKVFTLSVYETACVAEQAHNAEYIPVFHGNDSVRPLSEYGQYALYHGDLRLPDNRRAAEFLIRVFSKIPDYKLLIASGNAQQFIESRIQHLPNIAFVRLRDNAQLQQLLENAHINAMLSFQRSGTKLKIVNALYNSRFCVVNQNMADDERLLALCSTAGTEAEFIEAIKLLKNRPYTQYADRVAVLGELLDDAKNAAKLSAFLD